MAKLPQAGAEVVLDTSKWDSSYDQVIGDALKIEKAIDDLSGTVDVKVNVNSSDLTATKSELDVLERAANIDGRLDVAADDVDELQSQLETLQSLAVIDIALSIPDALSGLVETLSSLPGLGQVASNERATGLLSIPTGEFNPEDLALAQNLYTNAFFESTEEAAVFLNQLKSIGVESDQLEAAANGALAARDAFTAMGQDADLAQIAVAQNALVLNGLAENATEASDIIAAGVVGGANRRDDFLDSLIEYSSTFSNFGATADQVLNLFNSGLEAGFDNTDRVADLFREFQIRVSNPEETAAQESLANIGLADEAAMFQAGEISGVELFNGVIAGIQSMNDQTQAGEQQAALANIFGTQTEDFMGSVFGLDPVGMTFDTIEGRAAEISTLLNDNIGVAFTELFNTINVEAGNLLSSDAIDLDGKLEAIKTAVQTTVDEIQAGSTLSEAIKIGLEPLGFDDEFTKLEGVFGNFIIQFLEVIAGLQELLGKDATGTREEIARLGAQQLEFDLQVANPDEVTDLISQAMDRGVDPEKIGEIASTAVNAAIDAGNVAQAQNIVTGAQGATQTVTGADNLGILGGFAALTNPALAQGVEVPVELGIDTAALQANIDSAVTQAAASISRAAQDDMATAIISPTARPGSAQASAAGDDASTEFTHLQDVADAASTIAGAAVTAQDATTAAATASALSSQEFVNAIAAMQQGAEIMDSSVTLNADSAAVAMEDLGGRVTEVVSGNTITEDFALIKTTADENFPIVIAYLETLEAAFTEMGGAASVAGVQASSAIAGIGGAAGGAGNPFDAAPSANYHGGAFSAGEPLLFEGAGKEVVAFNTPGNVFGVQETAAMMEGLSSMGGAGGTTINNYNVNVSQNITNMAQAVGSANAIAKATRGMS